MARALRIQYPGAVYHVTCRGNERKEIFKDDFDKTTFLKILNDSRRIYNIKIHAYVLMTNHFHLLIETPMGNLSEFMRHFNITYTGNYNRRHKRAGHLYQGRYKSILVEKETYLSTLSRYIHLNPVNIKGIKGKDEGKNIRYIKGYKWSSLPGYINRKKKQEFIDYSFVLEEYGGDNDQGRTAYKNRIFNELSMKEGIKEDIVGQSILGRDEFIEWVKDTYLKTDTDKRERPSLRSLHSYRAQDEIIRVFEKETGRDIEDIKKERGSLRQILMDFLYRIGGVKGAEIGRIMGVDYSTVSQGRKRLSEKLQKDIKLQKLVSQLEGKLSR